MFFFCGGMKLWDLRCLSDLLIVNRDLLVMPCVLINTLCGASEYINIQLMNNFVSKMQPLLIMAYQQKLPTRPCQSPRTTLLDQLVSNVIIATSLLCKFHALCFFSFTIYGTILHIFQGTTLSFILDYASS